MLREDKLKYYRLLKEKAKRQARESYLSYCIYTTPKFVTAPHIKLMCESVESLLDNRLLTEDGKIAEILIISMPPQHGKSMTISQTLPSYVSSKYGKRSLIVSYGDDLSRGFGRSNKRKVEEFGKELFDIELIKGGKSDTDVELTNGAYIKSRGIQAGIAGHAGDFILIDDPIKNRAEADSDIYRDRIWGEFINSIYTRRSSDCKIILIQTRWHEDDLAGRIMLKGSGFDYKLINIPCEAEEDDILGREVGDALFPEIGKDNKWLRKTKRIYIDKEGKRSWSALYQGSPNIEEGNMVKRYWFKRYTQRPIYDLFGNMIDVEIKKPNGHKKKLSEMDNVLQSWDMAFKAEKDNDHVGCGIFATYGSEIFLIDQILERLTFTETLRAFLDITKKYPQATAKIVEEKANGAAIIDMLHEKIGGIIPFNPTSSKEARFYAITPMIEAGNFYVPNDTDWVEEYIDNLCKFPHAKVKEQVDFTSQALQRWIWLKDKDPMYDLPDYIEDDLREDLEADPRAMEDYIIRNNIRRVF